MNRIIGCGRSGSLYISDALQAVGIDMKHEICGTEGTASCYAMTPPPYLQTIGDFVVHRNEDCSTIPWKVTLHQVRDPLLQIESAYSVFMTGHWTWFETHFGVSKRLPKLVRCMEYWLRVNQHCETISEYRYRIEDIDTEWKTILERLGYPHKPLPKISKTTNRSARYTIPFRKDIKVDWNVLREADIVLANKIKKLAEKYGYSY
jgi:hypothetical protein